MTKDIYKNNQELLDRIAYLEKNRRFIQNALEMLLAMGDFQKNLFKKNDVRYILEQAARRVNQLISFDIKAFYLVSDESQDFTLSVCDPFDKKQYIEDEVEFLIDKGFFAWALREKRGVMVASKDSSKKFLLHVIVNQSRIRGMFIGLLPFKKSNIPDASLTILSITLLNTANALESIEFYTLMKDQKRILAEKVEERTKKLIRSERKIRQLEKMEALGALAGGVAHDLNNILSGLVSYPELLLMSIPEDSPMRKAILIIKKSGEKAATIVQDLLTMTRRGVAIKEVLNLNNIITEYLASPEYQMLRSYYPDIMVEYNLADNLLPILGSPVHLSKTVMNLVSNAAEAITGAGKITITTANRYIDRPVSGYDDVEEGDYVTLTITDTGAGISAEDIDHIFEPFYTKKVMGKSGTGLGMAVVWGTVRDHYGYIDLKSVEGNGTTFVLYFPVTRKEISDSKIPVSKKEYMGNGESILIVDDVKEQREIASEMLMSLNYTVNAVASGEKAIEYLQKKSADLLILDMIMSPGIDGLETYKRILKFRAGQKAIIASGYSETKRVKEAQLLGAGAYVKKPYVLETIGMKIKAELDRTNP
jgi:signal transduction histidine kinase/CheY-like chemotaxis protein